MKTTSHHVQFQPGGRYYPVALCMFDIVPAAHPLIEITFGGTTYREGVGTASPHGGAYAYTEAERIIEEALGGHAGNPEGSLPRAMIEYTKDGHVTKFGAITAPEGCYLLAAGETPQSGDMFLTLKGGEWLPVCTFNERIATCHQYTYARKLPEKGGE